MSPAAADAIKSFAERARDTAAAALETGGAAVAIAAVAWVYRAQKKYAPAAAIYQRVLKSKEAALGPRHPDLELPLFNLAEMDRELEDFRAAQPLYPGRPTKKQRRKLEDFLNEP